LTDKRPTLPLLLLPALLLSGCWVGTDFPDYDLSETPFSNPYLERGEALLRVEEASGFVCPDGSTPLIYFVSPATRPGAVPGAVLFHGGNFDYVDAGGDHFEDQDRLTGLWAQEQIHNVLGIGGEGIATDVRGAWVGALVKRGYRVAVPGNCWGDLWHGRGQGDVASEGFQRQGGFLASEVVLQLQAHEDATTDRLLALGLAEGGRAITELALSGVAIDAAVIDASPDALAPQVSGSAIDQPYTDGLLKIYDYEVREAAEADDKLDLLRAALSRDSLAHPITNLGYRVPVFYGYSSLDERISLDSTLPAATAILNHYPVGTYEIVDWETAETAPSNSLIDRTGAILDWLNTLLPPLPEPASE
jgi:hypothetical protein